MGDTTRLDCNSPTGLTCSLPCRFYNGAHLEKGILTRSYIRLVRHINSIFKIRIAYSMIEDFVIKYAWSAVSPGAGLYQDEVGC